MRIRVWARSEKIGVRWAYELAHLGVVVLTAPGHVDGPLSSANLRRRRHQVPLEESLSEIDLSAALTALGNPTGKPFRDPAERARAARKRAQRRLAAIDRLTQPGRTTQ